MTQNLTLIKKNSKKIEGIKASVQDKIYINNTKIPVEEGDIFEYKNPAEIVNYLEVTNVLYNDHPRLGHIEIKYQKTEKELRVYLDTNIVSRADDFRIKEEDARALRVISEKIDKKEISLFTSEKTKEEIEKTEGDTQREFILFLYNLVKKIPNSNMVENMSATLGTAPLGVAPLGGGYLSENPLFAKLKKVFDTDDAEHIFQAEKSGMDYFLTLDKKTIIDRISNRSDDFRKTGLKIKLVLPSDLMSILDDK